MISRKPKFKSGEPIISLRNISRSGVQIGDQGTILQVFSNPKQNKGFTYEVEFELDNGTYVIGMNEGEIINKKDFNQVIKKYTGNEGNN